SSLVIVYFCANAGLVESLQNGGGCTALVGGRALKKVPRYSSYIFSNTQQLGIFFNLVLDTTAKRLYESGFCFVNMLAHYKICPPLSKARCIPFLCNNVAFQKLSKFGLAFFANSV